jgi:putative transposase
MSQSLSNILIHLIYSTKHREPFITPDVAPELDAVPLTILKRLNCPSLRTGGMPDHLHILFRLSRTMAVADVVEEVKKETSKWIKTKAEPFSRFSWQEGYGAFSVSESNVPEVISYIENQQQHHKTRSFQDEYRVFLRKYKIPYDERYVWD